MGKGEMKSLEIHDKKVPWRRKCPREEDLCIGIVI